MSNTLLIEKVLAKLKEWAVDTHQKIDSGGIYVFGSVIRRGGVQFDNRSDIDLVIQIPAQMKTSSERVEWMENLHEQKQSLELALMSLLKRTDASEAICSVVVVSELDIEANVHKDGAIGFFSENIFLDLLTDVAHNGLPTVRKETKLQRLIIECLKFTQKKRNIFLAVSPNGTEKLSNFEGPDPIPKDIMRYAAMARQLEKPSTIHGAETDIQRGLDYLTHHLYEFEMVNEAYQKLHDVVSVRRGARGESNSISPLQQLLLTDIIVGAAIEAHDKELAAQVVARRNKDFSLPSFKGNDSTIFFSDRFSRAFPGVRGVSWFEDPAEIRERMNRLLKEPLKFEEATPIWWWRNSNLQIEKFIDLGNGHYVMNVDELNIRKIAAVQSDPYYRSFVYVEVASMKPTGLYQSSPDQVSASKKAEEVFGYNWEEYGLVDGVHMVTRAEYDDGAAKIEGEIQDITGRAELRSRYLTPYNFLIAPHGSPINNQRFDSILEDFLNKILSGEATIEQLIQVVNKLPKRNDR
ncbi:hypothetical protein KW842_25255 [Duganella sp. sic0402]|uniref:hypothetical protein n=1 Tax=Duganella sp. sic0402 TaxID=2854786 RepID=UPI001C454440|nr:hypothetical protein [Duganella sp. sic0402]MBV7539081.1 hypothetical protein [Duganella sp. sic0402]